MSSKEPFYCRYKSILISFQQICKSDALKPHKNHVSWAISVHQFSRYKLNSNSMAFFAQKSFKADGYMCHLLVE